MLIIKDPVGFLSRWVKQESEFSKQAQAPDSTPKLNLGFKEGQTITLNIGVILYKVTLIRCTKGYRFQIVPSI